MHWCREERGNQNFFKILLKFHRISLHAVGLQSTISNASFSRKTLTKLKNLTKLTKKSGKSDDSVLNAKESDNFA